jgi:hypothetical protein
MNLAVAILIVAGSAAVGVAAMLATGFAVLIGFVVFLAFTSYDSAS